MVWVETVPKGSYLRLDFKALKASPQLATLDLNLVHCCCCLSGPYRTWCLACCTHRQSKGKSRGEHRRWQIQPCTYRCRRQRAQWCTSMSWELWARPPGLAGVRTAPSALSAFRTVFLVHGAWHFGIVVNRRTHKHKVHRHQQIHLRTCHCHWHKPKKQATSPLKFEPHMDRQCLIICDPLTFRSEAPTYPHKSRPMETQTNNTGHVSYLMSPY